MFSINRLNTIFLKIMLMFLFCGLMSVNVVHAKAVNQVNTPSEQLDPEKHQYFSYTPSGQKVYYGVVKNEFVAQFKEGVTQKQIESLNAKYQTQTLNTFRKEGNRAPIYLLRIPEEGSLRDMLKPYSPERQEVYSVYGYEPIVEWTMPAFHHLNARVIPTDEFTVMFSPDASFSDLTQLNQAHGVEILERNAKDGSYRLRVTFQSDLNSLDMANLYHEQPFIVWATPDYLSNQEIEDPEARQYWYNISIEKDKDDKRYLEVKPDEFAVQFKQGVTQAQIDQLNSKYGVTIIEKSGRGNLPPIYILSVPKGKRLMDVLRLYPKKKKEVRNVYGYEPIVEWTMPSFYHRGHRKVPTDEFNVMLKSGVEKDLLLELNKQHGVEIIRNDASHPYWHRHYHMRVTAESDLNSLDMANLYHQQPFTEEASPNYLGGYKLFAIPNDARFSEQWNLHQASDIDIDAPEAWDIANDASNSFAASDVKQKSNSQEDKIAPEKRQYFWYDGSGKKVYFEVKADEFVVQFKKGVTKAQIDQLNSKYGSKIIKKVSSGGKTAPIYILSVPKGKHLKDVLKLYSKKKKGKEEVRNVYGYEPIVEWTMPSFYSRDYRKVPTDEFTVMLKPGVEKEELLELNKQHGVEIIRNDASHPYWHRHYLMRVTSESDLNSLDMANLYHEQPFTEYAAPNYPGGFELYAIPMP